MKALTFWKTILMDETNFLERFIRLLDEHGVLGMRLPVAAVADVLQGKFWTAQDPERPASKRQKDLADIARLLEAYPRLMEVNNLTG